MDKKEFFDSLYLKVNYSDIPIASLAVNEEESALYIQLLSGDKYKITISETDIQI